MKKVVLWYNQLKQYASLEFLEDETDTSEEK